MGIPAETLPDLSDTTDEGDNFRLATLGSVDCHLYFRTFAG